jgi:hypothetical protein
MISTNGNFRRQRYRISFKYVFSAGSFCSDRIAYLLPGLVHIQLFRSHYNSRMPNLNDKHLLEIRIMSLHLHLHSPVSDDISGLGSRSTYTTVHYYWHPFLCVCTDHLGGNPSPDPSRAARTEAGLKLALNSYGPTPPPTCSSDKLCSASSSMQQCRVVHRRMTFETLKK